MGELDYGYHGCTSIRYRDANTQVVTASTIFNQRIINQSSNVAQYIGAVLLASMLFGLLYRADTIFNGGDGQPLVLNTTEHYTLIFNAFVWMQIFNEVNSRKVNEEMNVFENFFDNSTFSMVILLSAGFQVLMVEVFGDFAKTTGLTWQMWVGSIVIGFMSLPWGVVIRLIPVNYESGRIILDFDKGTYIGPSMPALSC